MKLETLIINLQKHKDPKISKTLPTKCEAREYVLCNPKYNKDILHAVRYSNKD